MTRWIAFDQKTAAELRRKIPHQQIFEHGAADALDYAVGGPENLVAVVPVDVPGMAGVAVIRHPRVSPQPATESVAPVENASEQQGARNASVARTRAGGLLGLRDEPVFEEEEKPVEKRNWWRRFWDED